MDKNKKTTKKTSKKKADMTIKSLVATAPVSKKKEKKEDPRVTMLHKAQKDLQKSLNGNGGKTAILDPESVNVYANIAQNVMVWNGTGYKKDKDGKRRKQPLSGGFAYRPNEFKTVYKIASIITAIGNGDKFTKGELFNQ